MPPIQSRSEVPEEDSPGLSPAPTSGVAPPAALAEAQSGDAEEHPDVRLVNLAKGGDVHAFETLVKQYDRQVFRIAQHITQNREDAEDVVQDAFPEGV